MNHRRAVSLSLAGCLFLVACTHSLPFRSALVREDARRRTCQTTVIWQLSRNLTTMSTEFEPHGPYEGTHELAVHLAVQSANESRLSGSLPASVALRC